MEDPPLAGQEAKGIIKIMGKASPIPFSDAKKILIRSANWVGDAVMSLPAINSVRLSFPRAEIFILAKPWVAEIFQKNPVVDQVYFFQSPGIHQGLRGKWRLARQLKEEGFELAILLQNAFEAALISFLAGIPRRAGYNTDGRGFMLTHPVALRKEIEKGHQVDYYLEMVESLGFQRAKRIPSLQVSAERREEAGRMLQSFRLQESQRVVGISPGATYGSAKQWYPERYAELADRIARNLGARILMFGSEGDKKVALQVRQNTRIPLIDLTGVTTLGQAMALISYCGLFITNDSGLMHVAAALGVPVIAIFGSTNPERTGPVGEVCRVVRKPIPCAPCLKTECPEDRRCMGLISVDEVYEEVKTILSSKS
jgi:heptosyltransferase-2